MLSPYPHELNSQGTDCSTDCPACIWLIRKQAEESRTPSYPRYPHADEVEY